MRAKASAALTSGKVPMSSALTTLIILFDASCAMRDLRRLDACPVITTVSTLPEGAAACWAIAWHVIKVHAASKESL